MSQAKIIVTSGGLASFQAGGLMDSMVEGGSPTLDSSGLPSQFNASAAIQRVAVGAGGFSNSVIGAPQLGLLNLGPVATDNGGMPFGVAAHRLGQLRASVDGKKLVLRSVHTSMQIQSALAAQGISANDWVVRVD